MRHVSFHRVVILFFPSSPQPCGSCGGQKPQTQSRKPSCPSWQVIRHARTARHGLEHGPEQLLEQGALRAVRATAMLARRCPLKPSRCFDDGRCYHVARTAVETRARRAGHGE
eukprot:COSAG03_NODE_378_length_8385_cov_5.999638_6_plen_113_part_00